MSKIEEIKKLSILLIEGAITQEEFSLLKNKILDSAEKSISSEVEELRNENIIAPSISNPVQKHDDEKVIRRTKMCPFCGEEIKEIAIKCYHCGEMLQDGIPSNQQSTIKCPYCAELISSTETICPECKSQLSEEINQTPKELFIPVSWKYFNISASSGAIIIFALWKFIFVSAHFKLISSLSSLLNCIECFLVLTTTVLLFMLIRFMKNYFKKFTSLKLMAWINVLFTFLIIYGDFIDTNPEKADNEINIIAIIFMGIFLIPSIIVGLRLSKIYNDISGGVKSMGFVFLATTTILYLQGICEEVFKLNYPWHIDSLISISIWTSQIYFMYKVFYKAEKYNELQHSI